MLILNMYTGIEYFLVLKTINQPLIVSSKKRAIIIKRLTDQAQV